MEEPVPIRIAAGAFRMRRAVASDVPQIAALLRDDPIGRDREGAAAERLDAVFALIDADPAQLLLVVDDAGGGVVATMQVTFIPTLSRSGALRAQLEAVRVRSDHRGAGLGAAFLERVLAECRARGAGLVQLTTDKRRTDAQRFYGRHGFAATHEGMKRELG